MQPGPSTSRNAPKAPSSASSASQNDNKKPRLLKRLNTDSTQDLYHGLKEFDILKKLTLNGAPPYFTTLASCWLCDNIPNLVFNEALEFNLSNILENDGPLSLEYAKRLLAEIIVGLSYLHFARIIHMGLKESNIWISSTGHAIISGFDRSLDVSNRSSLVSWDYEVDQVYPAPEIAHRFGISDKVDVWSLGVMTPAILGGKFEYWETKEEVNGTLTTFINWKIDKFKKFPRDLQVYFYRVLNGNFANRLSLDKVKELRLFSDVQWEVIESGKGKPPFEEDHLSKLREKLLVEEKAKSTRVSGSESSKEEPISDEEKDLKPGKTDENAPLSGDRLAISSEKTGICERDLDIILSDFSFEKSQTTSVVDKKAKESDTD